MIRCAITFAEQGQFPLALVRFLSQAAPAIQEAFGLQKPVDFLVAQRPNELWKADIQLPETWTVDAAEAALRIFDEGWWIEHRHEAGDSIIIDYIIAQDVPS